MAKHYRLKEFLRFIVCGLASAICDYLLAQLVIFLIGNKMSHGWLIVFSTACGFVIGVIVNYLISTYWVYQNVDKDIKTKSIKFILLFFLFSLIALALSIATMLICDLVVTKVIKLESIVELSFVSLIKRYGVNFLTQSIFWAYALSFVLKTLVGLVWNYFTRRFILYREPKYLK